MTKYKRNQLYHVAHRVKGTAGGWSVEHIWVRGSHMRFSDYGLEPHFIDGRPMGQFRVHDGHLPEYQPVRDGSELLAFMEQTGANVASKV